jgi:hypothetical protein
MLGNLFPTLFGGYGGNNSSLDTGSKPQLLHGNEKVDLNDASILPNKPTSSDVNNMARRAGDVEAEGVLLRELSQQQLALQKAALSNIETRINHSKQSMENTKQFQQKMAKHGKNIHEFSVQTQANQQNFDAYESRFNSVNVEL